MSTATPAKKYVREYQPKDEFGNHIGPPQRFEADTPDELADKLAAAHENASVTLYKTKKAVKLGTLLEPDPEEPLPTFEEQVLSADDRLSIANALNDPNSTPDAVKKLFKAFGIPVEAVRQMLADNEIQKRIRRAQEQTQLFLNEHPEYVHHDENRDRLLKYLDKRNLALTKKNLEIAYEDLRTEGLLITQATPQTKTEVPVPAPAPAPTPAPVPAAGEDPVPSPAIPDSVTPPAPISATPPAPPRPPISSSGLSRENASVTPTPNAPKAKGISAQDITAMSANDYAYALKNGLWEFDDKRRPVRQTMTATDFNAAVTEMYKR